MGKIGLSAGFRNLEVGDAQVLAITASSYDERLAAAKVTFTDPDRGGSCTETFRFGHGPQRSRGQEVALDIYSTLAKHALHDWELEEIDPDELVGALIVADVYKQDVVNEQTGAVTGSYIHVRNFKEYRDED